MNNYLNKMKGKKLQNYQYKSLNMHVNSGTFKKYLIYNDVFQFTCSTSDECNASIEMTIRILINAGFNLNNWFYLAK